MLRTLGVSADADRALVAALRGGDPDAAAKLVDRYGERVYRLAARVTGAADDAEEVAQSTLATVVGGIEALASDTSLGSWIDRLTAREAYRRLLTRAEAAVQGDEIALDDVLPPLDGGGLHFEPMRDWSARIGAEELQGELRQALSDALDALPAGYRAALVLHDVEGMADADVAEALGVAPATVRARVHRARLFARKRLSERLTAA